ncbi:HAD family hydrolase [Vibrio owensii]|uniref:HAD family hydrolase n=1 Tax=Vibrio owensii TaxID=696485 RepID=UPI003CC53647
MLCHGSPRKPTGQKVVVFDFDETLTKKNTLEIFAKTLLGNKALFYFYCMISGLLVPFLFFSKRQKINQTPLTEAFPVKHGFIWKSRCIDAFRRTFLRLISKHASPELEDMIAKELHSKIEYIDEVVSRLNDFTINKNIEVWIATGSSKVFVEAIAKYNKWNVSKVIGTDLYGYGYMATLECIRRNKSHMIKVDLNSKGAYVHEAFGNYWDDMYMLDMSKGRSFCVGKDQSIFEITPTL